MCRILAALLVLSIRLPVYGQDSEGLKQVAEAKENYEAYLKFDPSGRFISQAKKCLDRLQNERAGELSTQKQSSKR
jgi:hypothetical protein